MTSEERITYLEEAVERLAEHIDLLAYLHAEQRYRVQVAILKQALAQPGTVEKLQQITEVIAAAKAKADNVHAQVPG